MTNYFKCISLLEKNALASKTIYQNLSFKNKSTDVKQVLPQTSHHHLKQRLLRKTNSIAQTFPLESKTAIFGADG